MQKVSWLICLQLGLLRRLHTFSLKEIPSAAYPEPVPNDDIICRLALLSQMAIFKDIIPGYRIRPLSDQEKAEKVTQFVQRTREWEQGLVGVYQSYLRGLEQEVKGRPSLALQTPQLTRISIAKTALADDALRCMCTLLKEVTHFNFRTNLLASIIARLSKKSWDEVRHFALPSLLRSPVPVVNTLLGHARCGLSRGRGWSGFARGCASPEPDDQGAPVRGSPRRSLVPPPPPSPL
jgi:nucleolar complex protein 3